MFCAWTEQKTSLMGPKRAERPRRLVDCPISSRTLGEGLHSPRRRIRSGFTLRLVGVTNEPSVWSEEEIVRFKELNEAGIAKMKQDLAKENPADLERRQYQAATLEFMPVYIEGAWEESSSSEADWDASFRDSMTASIRSFLSPDEINDRMMVEAEASHTTNSGLHFRWSSGTQRGYYADFHDKPNQDDKTVQLGIAEEGSAHWFSVYDGHGRDGHKCAAFARKEISKEFQRRAASGESVQSALEKAHMDIHERLIAIEEIETEQSGTTATTLLLMDDKCIISNVGDSIAILGWQATDLARSAKFLCSEQTPMRADERQRIQRAGGVVMTVDQRDGLEPMHENWDEHEAPPRIWSTEDEKFPGCCFTRSIGDGIAHTLGVSARPEFFEHEVGANDRVLILSSYSSDSMTVMDEHTCVQIACSHESPEEAVRALIDEARERWMARGDYMDDITAIVIFLDAKGGSFANQGRRGSNTFLPPVVESEERPTEVAGEQELDDLPLGLSAQFWTLLAGAASGFLGGLCGIRGPPIILYFLHPPYPVRFDKKTQRATGASITATNVAMRIVYYLVETFAFDGESYFTSDDWVLYVMIVVCSLSGVLVGSKIFERMKDSRNNIRMILSLFLLLCGVSLLLSSFAHGV